MISCMVLGAKVIKKTRAHKLADHKNDVFVEDLTVLYEFILIAEGEKGSKRFDFLLNNS